MLSGHKEKRFTFMVQRDGSTRFRRYTFGGKKLYFFTGLGAVLLLFILVVSVLALSELRVRGRTGRLIAENRLLDHQITEVRNQLSKVESVVDSLSREQDLIRVRVDLPVISEDVRQAGVGSRMPLEGQVIGDDRIEELLVTLDQLERELSVQSQSFDEIRKKILSDEKRLKHIPALIPVKSGRLTDGFGYRRDPFNGNRRFHYGADFAAPRGTPVYATADGKVIKTRREAGFGKVIEIDHGYGYTTVFGHLDDFKVRRGQMVKRGDLIGYVGNTGRSTGPHLHYEVRVEGRAVDPLDYFYEGYELAGGRK